MTEHGRIIPGLPAYTITRNGHIFSWLHCWRGKDEWEMTQHLNSCGYSSVRLTTFSGRKRYTVHKLLAHTYLPPCPEDCDQLRHLDGDKTNNTVDNLAWGTAQDNANDREKHGRTSRGDTHGEAIKKGLPK